MKEKFEDYVAKNKFTKGLQYEDCKNAILDIISNIEFINKMDFKDITIDILKCEDKNQNVKITLCKDRIDIFEHGSIYNVDYDTVIFGDNITIENFNDEVRLESRFNVINDEQNYVENYNQIKNELFDILEKYEHKKILLMTNQKIINVLYCLYNGWMYTNFVNINIPKYTVVNLN